jgi:hypothetical protein
MRVEVSVPDGYGMFIDGLVPVQYAPTVPVRNVGYRVWTYLDLSYEEDASVVVLAFIRRGFGYAISLRRSNPIGSTS